LQEKLPQKQTAKIWKNLDKKNSIEREKKKGTSPAAFKRKSSGVNWTNEIEFRGGTA